MNNMLFLLLFLLFWLFVLYHGLRMIFDPQGSIRSRDSLIRWKERAKPNPEWKPGFLFGTRLGGLALTSSVVFVLYHVAGSIVGGRLEPAVPASSQGESASGADRFSYLAGLIFSAAGILILANPERFIRWGFGALPHRKFSDEHLRSSIVWGRILGGFVALVGVYLLYTELIDR